MSNILLSAESDKKKENQFIEPKKKIKSPYTKKKKEEHQKNPNSEFQAINHTRCDFNDISANLLFNFCCFCGEECSYSSQFCKSCKG
jgi:hypothetical protein